MSRRTVTVRDDGPYPCDFGCGAVLASKFKSDYGRGWTWFTGYADSTLHFCPRCSQDRHNEIQVIKARTEIKPANYPIQRIHINRTLLRN